MRQQRISAARSTCAGSPRTNAHHHLPAVVSPADPDPAGAHASGACSTEPLSEPSRPGQADYSSLRLRNRNLSDWTAVSAGWKSISS